MPRLAKGGSGVGALMAALWNLLKSKQNDEEWNPACRGGLRSAVSGRQYPRYGCSLPDGLSTAGVFYAYMISFKRTV